MALRSDGWPAPAGTCPSRQACWAGSSTSPGPLAGLSGIASLSRQLPRVRQPNCAHSMTLTAQNNWKETDQPSELTCTEGSSCGTAGGPAGNAASRCRHSPDARSASATLRTAAFRRSLVAVMISCTRFGSAFPGDPWSKGGSGSYSIRGHDSASVCAPSAAQLIPWLIRSIRSVHALSSCWSRVGPGSPFLNHVRAMFSAALDVWSA